MVILLFFFLVVSGSGFSLLLGGEGFWWLGLESVCIFFWLVIASLMERDLVEL